MLTYGFLIGLMSVLFSFLLFICIFCAFLFPFRENTCFLENDDEVNCVSVNKESGHLRNEVSLPENGAGKKENDSCYIRIYIHKNRVDEAFAFSARYFMCNNKFST